MWADDVGGAQLNEEESMLLGEGLEEIEELARWKIACVFRSLTLPSLCFDVGISDSAMKSGDFGINATFRSPAPNQPRVRYGCVV